MGEMKIVNGILCMKIRGYDSGFVYWVSKEIEVLGMKIGVWGFEW